MQLLKNQNSCFVYCNLPAMFILREKKNAVICWRFPTGVGIVRQRAARSAAEWFRQFMMLDPSNNLTLLIVSHGPVANGIPAIRGL